MSDLNEACRTRQQSESRLHTCTSSYTGTTVSSSKVVASVVSSQLRSEVQFSCSTPVNSEVLIDPLMLKIDDHLSNPYVDITESCSVDNEPPAKKLKNLMLRKSS